MARGSSNIATLMENGSSFNLEGALAKWREELAQKSELSTEQARELETHVRDSFAALAQIGLSEEERFLIAIRRIGKPEQLGAEYEKLPRRTHSRVSRTTRVLIWAGAIGSFLALALGELIGASSRGFIPGTNPGQWHPGSVLLAAFYDAGWLLALLMTASGAAGLLWAYLRAKRSVVRYAIIGGALLLGLVAGLPHASVVGQALRLALLAPEWWFEALTGHPIELFPSRRLSPGLGVSTGVFSFWWMALWMLLFARELIQHLRSRMPLRVSAFRQRIVQVLDAE